MRHRFPTACLAVALLCGVSCRRDSAPAEPEAAAETSASAGEETEPEIETRIRHDLPLDLELPFSYEVISDGNMVLGELTARTILLDLLEISGEAAISRVSEQLAEHGFVRLSDPASAADDELPAELWSDNGRPFPAADLGFSLQSFPADADSRYSARLSIEIYSPTEE